ncbi:hypothetical protein [Psychrobacter nivimaris]|uniref:hypothetical protein n=1 Tax=Psychrobacter nivimaris TaxID=281738 RepID=UPI00191B1982|nr:hypothetical protein [Psychrobacter nivimaris]
MEVLFGDWKNRESHRGKLFITDGVIDKELWDNSQNRVLFLLKEAYDSKRVEGSWDLPALIRREKVSGRTFKPMAQWAYGIHGLMDNKGIIPFQEDGPDVKLALLSSSIINLKKSSGAKKSSSKNLARYVEEDWDLISEQIAIIQPKIVICGNTWCLIRTKISHQKISDRAYLSGSVLYIDYWHPANRASNKMNYYALCALVQLAISKLENNLIKIATGL